MKKRTIPKKKYEENREAGDKAAAKLRKKVSEEKGPKAVKGKHVDHVEPIAKGGSPTAPDNMKLVKAKKNLKKGAKAPKKA